MEVFVILTLLLAGLVIWILRRDRKQSPIDRDPEEWGDDVWERVVNEAGREYLITTAINQGVNNAEMLDNHTLVRLIRKNL